VNFSAELQAAEKKWMKRKLRRYAGNTSAAQQSIQLSFDQEALMEKVKLQVSMIRNTLHLRVNRKKLPDDSKMNRNSLLALSKRNPKISPLVNKEITTSI